MIDHSSCDHERTPKARAKCRRARAEGEDSTPKRVKKGASVKELDFTPEEKERNRGTTPRDRDMQCDVCGIERIVAHGKHRLRDLHMYVGEKCFYYLDPEAEIRVLP
jgi:hypothetical protein